MSTSAPSLPRSVFFFKNPRSTFFRRALRAEKIQGQPFIFGRFNQFHFFVPNIFDFFLKNQKIFKKNQKFHPKPALAQNPEVQIVLPEVQKKHWRSVIRARYFCTIFHFQIFFNYGMNKLNFHQKTAL